MVDLAQTIEEWKDIQSVKVDDQVNNGDDDYDDDDGDDDDGDIEDCDDKDEQVSNGDKDRLTFMTG